jgi:hypothetical protein
MHLTLIASTGDQFTDFSPYVASVNDGGIVAFQAALHSGATWVFTGNGGAVAQVAGPDLLRGVTSHPDLNNAGQTCFYGSDLDGREGVFLLRQGRLQVLANRYDGFASIGPLGPTLNEAGMVAFRADRTAGANGMFVGDGVGIATVAETNGAWIRFHGLPVITGDGSVVFRADRKDGVQGIYAANRGSTRAVAETGDMFQSFGRFPSASSDGVVAFAATLRNGKAAIFTADVDRITQVVDTDGAFEACRGALITNSNALVILATPRGGSLGLFAGPDPEADRILAVGDELRGSTVAELASNPVSVNASGQVAIRATLTDGRQFIVRADPGST